MSTQKERIIKVLGVSEAEADEILKADKEIEQGKDLFELSKEGKEIEKKMRQADRKPTVYKFDTRKRKIDNDKRFLIDALVWALTEQCEDNPGDHVNATEVNIVNPEREIEFVFNDKKYKIVLSAPRK